MRAFVMLAVGAAMAALSACSKPEPPVGPPHIVAASDIEAGRYLATVSGCNDCHTRGYSESHGATPEADRLTGVAVGRRGPWGVSYPSNLRLLVQNITEDGWVELLRTKRLLPPMPSQNISKMSDSDLRNLYRYIHSLGGAGEVEPENLPPGVVPKGPYQDMSVVVPKA